MKKLIAAALIVIMALGNALVFADYHNTGKWGDEGDGTYTNPVLPYDYSDPDPQTVREYITVEDPSIYPASQRYRYIAETNDYAQDDDGEYIAQDVYYMVSSTFTKAGLGVLLRSYDMVNWETVNHIFKDPAGVWHSNYNWDRTNVARDGGMWAPSLRYIEYKDESGYTHRRFMVYTTGADEGFFVAYTEGDPTGDWTCQPLKDMYGVDIRSKRWDDCCPVWTFNEDGTIKDAYFIASCNNRAWYPHIFKLSHDGLQLLDGDFNYMRPWDDRRTYTAGDATRMRTGETPTSWESYEHYDGIESGNPTDGAILLWNGDGYFDTPEVKEMFESEEFSNDGYETNRQNKYSTTYDSYEDGHCLVGDEPDARTLDETAENYKEYYSIRHYKMTEAQVDALLAKGVELKGNKEDGSIYEYIAFPCGYEGYSDGSRDETTPNTKYHMEQWFRDREVFIPDREGTVICDRRQTEANKAYVFKYQGKYDEEPVDYYYWFSNMRVDCPEFTDENGWTNEWNSGSVSSGEGEYLVPVMYRAKSPYGDIYEVDGDGNVAYTPGTPTRPGSFEYQQLFTGGEWGEPSQGGYLILNDDMASDGYESPENEPRMYVISQYNVVQYTGRMDMLLPVTWVDGWPMWGVIDEPKYVDTDDYIIGRSETYATDTIGEGQMIEPAKELWADIDKPPVKLAPTYVEQGLTENPILAPQNSDDFSYKTENANSKGLSYDWQFYFQPREEFYNLTERPGYLRMYAFEQNEENNFRRTANVLSMRTVATDYLRQDVKLDISNMQDGQYAGISHNGGWGWIWSNIAVKMADGRKTIVYMTGNNGSASTAAETECAVLDDDVTEVIFRSVAGTDRVNQFSYSVDGGETFERCGEKYTLQAGTYGGDMLSLFTYNNNADTKAQSNGQYTYQPTPDNNYGYVDFDYFDYTYLRTSEEDTDLFTKIVSEPIKDATLHQNGGSTTFGDSGQLQFGWGRRVAMTFDLTFVKEQLEAGKTLSDATLNLYRDYGNSQPGAVLYFAENDDWSEYDSTYNNLIANDALEVSDLLQGSTSITYSNDPNPILIMGNNALIEKIKEEALGDGYITLYLDYENGSAQAMGFISREGSDAEKHPNLTVMFDNNAESVPTTDPEASAQPSATPETTEPDTYKSEPAQDATLHEFSGDANYGSEEHLQLGWGRRVAMKFDLSQIKSQLEHGKTVDGATLDLYLNYGTTQPGATLYFAENDDWNETEVTYNNTIANGALGVSDLLHESASIDYSNDPGPILSLSGDELAAKISEEAQGDGVITIYLDYTNGDANAMGFASKDSATMEKHPTLTVTYSVGAVSDPTASPEASAQPTATNEPTEEIEFEGVASLPLIYAPDNRISTAVLELDPDNDEEAYYAAAYALLSPRADVKEIVAKSQLSKMTSFVKAIDDSVDVYSDISEVTEPYTYRVSGGVIYNGSNAEYTASGKSVSNSQLKNNSGSLGSWLYEEYDSDGDLQLSNIDALSRITLQPYGKYDYAAEDMVSLIHLYDQTEYNDYYTAKINETEPAVKPKVIVNSDCCNEVDDEFAVLHAALRDEFDIKAFIGTQHHSGLLVGMKGYLPNLDMYELSSNTATIAYKEMLLMWDYMGAEYDSEKAEHLKSITYQGSNDALADVATADCTELDGARVILEEMKNATSDAPLYIMNFGAFTDVARAMDLAEAEGADIDYENIIVICSAGGGQTADFNKNQDRDAFAKVCGQIESWQIASEVYGDSYAIESELWAKFGNKSRLGEMICGNLPRFMEQEKNNTWPAGNGYTLGDSPVVAALLNYLADGDVMTYESYDFVVDPTNEAGYYLSPNEDGLVKKCVSLNGRAVMYDMFDAFDEYSDNLIEAETKEYNISTTAEHGTIAVTDSEGNAITTATNGSLIKVKAESYIGYKVKDVLLNGESVNYTVLAGTNSFIMPESDVELEVVYETTTTDNVTTIDFTDYSPYIRRISGSNGFLNGTNLDSTQNSPIFSLGAADVSDFAKITLTGATNSAAYTASVYALDEETTDAEAVTSGTKLADITISATGDWNTIATFEGDAYGVEGTKYLYLSLPGGGWRGNFYSMTLEYEGSAPVTDVLDAEISASGDIITARYAVPIAETRTLTGYFAAYNGDGILVDFKLIEALPAGDSALEFEYNSEYEYKAFIWDSAQEPVIESVSY